MSERELDTADDREPVPSGRRTGGKPYTAEQRAADARRWAEADREDDGDGWEDRRLRISTAFSTR
jgi:hypothetical protein